MLVANELRINNYIRYKNPDYEDIPRRITFTNYPNKIGLERVSVNLIEYNHISPILLNEQWLFNFGFERDYTDQTIIQYKKDKFKLLYINSIFYYNDNLNYYVEFKYVHQIQNFYFYMTYEELLLN